MNYFSSYISKLGALIYKEMKISLKIKKRHQFDVNVHKVNSIIGQTINKFEIERILVSLGLK